MLVKELIAKLKELDPESPVKIPYDAEEECYSTVGSVRGNGAGVFLD